MEHIEHIIKTTSQDQIIDITSILQQEIRKSGVKEGIAVVFVPHTTAGVTINENADPDVIYDLLSIYRKAFPESGSYRHMEGNSHAHAKASMIGASCTIIIENGQLLLGTWQGVLFCEFDGPRTRKIYIKIMQG